MLNEKSTGPGEQINVCVCSFSEDGDSLSQWRAYGGPSGFAIGFSPEVLVAAVEKQGFFLAQCIYDPSAQLDIVRALVEEVVDEYLSKSPPTEDAEMDEVSRGLEAEISCLTSIDMPRC